MRKLYPVKITKDNLKFLMTSVDIIKEDDLRNRVAVRILSRLSALGFWGYKIDKI